MMDLIRTSPETTTALAVGPIDTPPPTPVKAILPISHPALPTPTPRTTSTYAKFIRTVKLSVFPTLEGFTDGVLLLAIVLDLLGLSKTTEMQTFLNDKADGLIADFISFKSKKEQIVACQERVLELLKPWLKAKKDAEELKKLQPVTPKKVAREGMVVSSAVMVALKEENTQLFEERRKRYKEELGKHTELRALRYSAPWKPDLETIMLSSAGDQILAKKLFLGSPPRETSLRPAGYKDMVPFASSAAEKVESKTQQAYKLWIVKEKDDSLVTRLVDAKMRELVESDDVWGFWGLWHRFEAVKDDGW